MGMTLPEFVKGVQVTWSSGHAASARQQSDPHHLQLGLEISPAERMQKTRLLTDVQHFLHGIVTLAGNAGATGSTAK
jgi:hypothetical protein